VKVGESDEERLARRAAVKIRAWAEKRSRVFGENSLPRIAIKFCGGCNPNIERGQIARIIRQELAGQARWISADEEVDLLLIIVGCLISCADRPEVKEKTTHYLTINGPGIFRIQRKENGR
jgi:hypothetical protein